MLFPHLYYLLLHLGLLFSEGFASYFHFPVGPTEAYMYYQRRLEVART